MSELLNNYEDNSFQEKQPYDRLVDSSDSRYKSEFTSEQRSCIAILESASEHFRKKSIIIWSLNNFIKYYIELGASVDRKSRLELVDSLKAKIDFLEKQQISAQQNNQIR